MISIATLTTLEHPEMIKTGTTTIGIVCKDGIVLAADKRVTAGNLIANRRFHKVFPITETMAVTVAGLVSDAQLISKLIKAELKLKDLQTNRTSTVKEAANLLAGMLYSNIRKMSMVQSVVGFLLGGKDESGYHLYDLGIDGSTAEHEDFVSDGSGSVFALGVLETLYKKGISIDEGIKLAVKAVNAAIQRDNCSGNGIDVVTISASGAQQVLEKEINTRLEL